jgi:hypothetical protein
MKPAPATLLLCCLTIAVIHFFYYPKWQQENTEATISYDVSGYYLYLPAAFIYEDLRQVAFLDDVMEQYHPSGHPYQVFLHENGNKVMKYSLGQAVVYLPAFVLGHAWAKMDNRYPADGFSRPYQFAVSMESLIICFLGLYWLMIVLLAYFKQRIVALTLLLITVGTNYLNYTAIDGAMTHNTIFTLYALLLLVTHRFYLKPSFLLALIIGSCIGLAALTRPTEIVAALIPLLWWQQKVSSQQVSRLSFYKRHWPKFLLAVLVMGLIGALQLLYWKYVSGDWLVYSYQDQRFDWLSPHLNQGFFSYKAGWLIYTPLMLFALIGFVPLFQKSRSLFLPVFVHSLLFIYVTFSWSVWWYGGSLGQRAMVQAYAVLAFPLAALLAAIFQHGASHTEQHQKGARTQVQGKLKEQWSRGLPILRVVFIGLILLSSWHNLWFTHQAHRGRLFFAERMTPAYFWQTLYRFHAVPEDFLRLDTPEFFTSSPKSTTLLLAEDFEALPQNNCSLAPVSGNGALCLKDKHQISPEFTVDINLEPKTWIRASVDVKIDIVRFNKDNYAQILITFRKDGEEVKRRLIRMHRLLNADFEQKIKIDSKVPDDGADQVVVFIWNGGDGQPELLLDNLLIEAMER